jgi:WD40 repeat protein
VPQQSQIAKRFFAPILSVTLGKAVDWPVILNILEGHTSEVTSVIISRYGRRIVWSASGMQKPGITSQANSKRTLITTLVVSQDGTRVVFGLDNRRALRLGMRRSFLAHSRGTAIGSRLLHSRGTAIGWFLDRMKTIRIWATNTGDVISVSFRGHRFRHLYCVLTGQHTRRFRITRQGGPHLAHQYGRNDFRPIPRASIFRPVCCIFSRYQKRCYEERICSVLVR